MIQETYHPHIIGTGNRDIYKASFQNIFTVGETREKKNNKLLIKQAQFKKRWTLSRYNSVAHVEIIVIWHFSSFERLSSFRRRNVLNASCKQMVLYPGNFQVILLFAAVFLFKVADITSQKLKKKKNQP